MKKNMMDVANGLIPADLVLKNGFVLNMFTEEIIKTDIAIVNDTIVGLGNYVGEHEIDCTDKYIAPGFIDAHMHIESSMVTPLELAKCLVKKGTTTMIIDPHEIVNVVGTLGLDYMLEATEHVPVNTYIMVPSCVPATDIDTNGAGEFLADSMQPYLQHERILGLAEVMRFQDVIHFEPKIVDKLNLFSHKMIDGHAPGITEKAVQSYKLAGIQTDHESETASEALEKLRAGFFVLIREGSAARNLEAIIKGLLQANIDFDQCLFCTDDKHLEDIEIEGHINFCVRKAIKLGVPILKAYKMASYHTARAYGLTRLGAIGAGFKADLLILDNLEDVNPVNIIKAGKMIDETTLMAYEAKMSHADILLNTVKFNEITITDLFVEKKKQNPVINLMPHSLLTETSFDILPGKCDVFIPNEQFTKLCVVERHGKNGKVGVCALKGYGIKNGAIATSVSHDAHNIIAAGDNDADITLAVNTLKETQGGYIVVSEGKVLATLALPLAGLMSLESQGYVQQKLNEMVKIARELHVSEDIDPFMTLSFLSLTVIPKIRLTELGLYDVNQQAFLEKE